MQPTSVLSFLATAVLGVFAFPTTPVNHAAQYDGVKVLRVPVGQNIAPLDDLITSLGLQKWSGNIAPHSRVDLEVPQDKYDEFVSEVNKIFADGNITQSVIIMHENLAHSIREERGEPEGLVLDRRTSLATQDWFTQYHSYEEHILFLKDLVSRFPNNSRIVTSGTSQERRTITGINIYGSCGPEAKPAIVVHGTAHAREWISTMVTESLAYNLLNNATSGVPEVRKYLEKYDFYFFPMVNPDGFVYTQTTERLWRKNRSPPPPGSSCAGIDINRNWAHSAWGQPVGASTDPCQDNYKGTARESAPETRALAEFLKTRTSIRGVKLYLDIHAYSQLFLSPYGYVCNTPTWDAAEQQRISAGYAAAISAPYGTRYDYGPSCDLLYPSSGSSKDYAYDNLNIVYSFAIELRDTGNFGFILPPNQIIPSAIENWAGFKYLLANMK